MGEIITVGLDIAKNVFQVHAIDEEGEVIVRRQLRRRQVLPFFSRLQPCLIGMEACATSHYWAREIGKLGHEVRMMPPRYVKPYVKRNKNDAADAEAICEAVTRPTMRFVPIKTPQQQSILMVHRTRQLFVQQRTSLINAIRAHLAEYGIVAGVGRNGLDALLQLIAKGTDVRLPEVARECLLALVAQLALVRRQIDTADRKILECHRESEVSKRLEAIPGVGPVVATALVASVPDPHVYRSGRDLSAWIGLVPKQNSTGGKERLGAISKAGNRYLRKLLVIGAMAVIKRAKQLGYTRYPWLTKLIERRPTKVAAVALANKIARTAWAMMARSGQPICALASKERVVLTGTQSAESIMASGHEECRINRPNTWQLRQCKCTINQNLDNTVPSTHGTLRSCVTCRWQDIRVNHPKRCLIGGWHSHGSFCQETKPKYCTL
jgi:transposase